MATLTGTSKNDSITGTSGSDVIDGGAGNDNLSGGAGNDLVIGGAGNDEADGGTGDDVIYGGAQTLNATGSGNDHLSGGEGSDTIYGGDGNDEIDGGSGNDVLLGEAGNDHLSGGDGNDGLSGGDGNDELQGDAGNDGLSGGDGNDQLAGGDGNDTLAGDAGNDQLDGGSGNDVLAGGLGADRLSGGSGNDVYAFNAANDSKASASGGFDGGDTINGFASTAEGGAERDKIDLRGLAAEAGHALNWSGTTATSYGVWYATAGGATYVYVDTTGNAVADTAIKITSGETLSAADFLGVAAGDVTPPAISAITYGGNDGTLKAGETVTLAVTFSENVLVADGIPCLTLNSGGTATYASGSGSNKLVFTYVVGAGENADDLAVTGLTLNSATIRDGAGNNAVLTGAATNPAGTLVVDTLGPVAGQVALAGLDDTGRSGTDGITRDNSFTLSISGNEAGAAVSYEVSVNGGAWTGADPAQANLADATYQFRALVTDLAGNQSYSAVQTVTVDTQGPQFSVTLGPITEDNVLSALESKQPVAITGTLTGEFQVGAQVTVTVNGVDYAALVANGSFSVLVAGSDLVADAGRSVHVSVSTVDDAGNAGTATADVPYALSTQGVATDGYISGALVFADANGNGQLDSGEASATTDAFGNFELTGGTGRLVLQGGTDISTGLAFTGTLTALAGSTVVTPLTTLLATLTDATNDPVTAEALLKSALGLDVNTPLGSYDPVQAVLAGAPGAADAMTAAVLLQNTITQVASVLTGADPGLSEADARAAVLDGIAQQLAGSGGAPLDLIDAGLISTVLGTAATTTAVTITPEVLDAATQVIQQVNTATQEAGNATDPLALLTGLAQVQIAVDGTVAGVLQSNDAGALGSFDQAALSAAISDALNDVGDVDGGAITGTEAAETLTGTAGDDQLFGFGGDDTITGNAGNDLIAGGQGDDTLTGNGGNDVYVWNAGDGNDTIITSTGEHDVIRINGSFHDYDWDVQGNDLILTVVNDGSYSWDNGSLRIQDFLGGGDGIDYVDVDLGNANGFYSPGAATSHLYFSAVTGEDQGNNNELIVGTAGDDVMSDAGGNVNVFWAGDGNDTITAADGSFALMIGGRGDDVMNGSDAGGVFRGGSGDDTMNGGASTEDLVRYDRKDGSGAFGHGVFVNLSDTQQTADFNGGPATVDAGHAIDNWGDSDTLDGIEKVRGSDFADVIFGSSGDNEINGLGGDDTLVGGGGYDYLDGGDGNDLLIGGSGMGSLSGGEGDDTIDGTGGSFSLSGDGGDDHIIGGSAGEFIQGGEGDDLIRAGGAGAGENNYVWGDEGADTFVFGADAGDTHIEDFQLGTDHLLLEDGVTITSSDEQDWDSYGITTVLGLSNGSYVALVGVSGITDLNTLFSSEIAGTPGDDVLYGTSGSDTFTGGTGDDALIGNGGDDVYVWSAGDGNDTIYTAAGRADVIQVNGTFYDYGWFVDGNDLVVGVVADDNYDFNAVGGSLRIADFLTGGDGIAYLQADLGDNNGFYNPGGGDVSRIYFNAVTGEDQGSGYEVIIGTSGDDVMTDAGGAGQNRFWGGDGNDTMTAAAGTAAVFLGGNGDDAMTGAENDDILRGGAGNDVMDGGDGSDLALYLRPSGSAPFTHGAFVNLSGAAVTETFNGLETTVAAGQALDNWGDTDTLLNIEKVRGSNFDDIIIGTAGGNVIDEMDGNDVIRGGGSAVGEVDFLSGGGGADAFVFGSEQGDSHIEDFVLGSDYLRLEDGVTIDSAEEQDWNAYGMTTVLTLSTGATVALVGVSGIADLNDLLLPPPIMGTPDADTLMGTAKPDTFIGGGGDDTLTGNGGPDSYVWHAGDGYDTIITTAGEKDVIQIVGSFYDYDWHVEGNDLVLGVVSDDSYTPEGNLRIQDFFAGGDGIDYMVANVNPNNQYPTGNRFYVSAFNGEDQGNQFEWVFGNDGNDVMTGGGGAIDRLFGLAGDDTMSVSNGTFGILLGGDGNDTLTGADQNDNLRGGSGNDVIDGGDGFDQVLYQGKYTSTAGFSHGVFVNLSGGDVTADFNGLSTTVAAGHALDNWGDTDTLSNVEWIVGSNFSDIILGSEGGERLEGREGDDTLVGGGGGDDLLGGGGNDQIFGGSAGDQISGGAGDDLIRAGGAGPGETNYVSGDAGSDSFVFGADAGDTHIEDFVIGVDRLQLEDGLTITGSEEQDWNEYGVTTVLSLSNGAYIALVGVSGIQDIGDLMRPWITGTPDADTLSGTAAAETILGNAGDDTLTGNGGDDVYVWNAGDGDDTIITTDGERDVVRINGTFYDYDWHVDGNDFVVGVVADDSYAPIGTLRFHDFLAGGDGIAYVDMDLGAANGFYSPGSPTSKVYFNVVHGEDQGNNAEVIVGTWSDDTMTDAGGQGQNVFFAGAGNDTMTAAAGTLAKFIGGDGDDVMNGSDSGNVFRGGAGNDTMSGGASGDDLVRYDSNSGSAAFSHGAFVNLSAGDVTAEFNGATTTLGAGLAIDNWGGTDTLTGIEFARGSGFDDVLVGGDGANRLEGRGGHDVLVGGGGDDQLFGGAGSDTFVFHNLNEGTDTINDFAAGDGGDVLDFSDLGFADAADALAHGAQFDADVVFTLDSGTTVVLAQTDYASLSASNFLV